MRKKSYYYSQRQNTLIERAAVCDDFKDRADSLSKQFKRPKSSILVKMKRVRMEKELEPAKTVKADKQNIIKIVLGKLVRLDDVKKAEMYSDHFRIYF